MYIGFYTWNEVDEVSGKWRCLVQDSGVKEQTKNGDSTSTVQQNKQAYDFKQKPVLDQVEIREN